MYPPLERKSQIVKCTPEFKEGQITDAQTDELLLPIREYLKKMQRGDGFLIQFARVKDASTDPHECVYWMDVELIDRPGLMPRDQQQFDATWHQRKCIS
jgi:hypothetical protein